MKTSFSIITAASFALAPASYAQSGGPYTLKAFSIGGGGVIAGGTYSLSGTIGHAHAGTIGEAPFSLEAGFWAMAFAVQQPDAPELSIRRGTGPEVIIAWPFSSGGFVLEETPTLVTPSWSPTAAEATRVGDENVVIIPQPSGLRFYRLRKP